MKYSILLFDLDGTLTDPKKGITKSVQHALNKLGIEEPDLEKLIPFIGPPLKNSFIKHYHFDEEKAWQAVQYYREYFSEKGMLENNIYEGIHDLLKKLYDSGLKLYVATSKPTFFSKQIVHFFNLDEYFEDVVGPSLTDREESKVEIIKRILQKNSTKKLRDFVMIGDREQDILAAKANGIDSIGVLFGYGSKKEIEDATPTKIVTTVKDLEKLLL